MKTLNGSVLLSDKNLRRMPQYPDGSYLFANVKVKGCFSVRNNSLTTLEGSPISVTGYFACGENPLKDLVGAPKHVGTFSCSYAHLTSLKGCPEKVDGNFYITGNYGRVFSKEEISAVCDVRGEIYV